MSYLQYNVKNIEMIYESRVGMASCHKSYASICLLWQHTPLFLILGQPPDQMRKATSQVSISHMSTTSSIKPDIDIPELTYGPNPRLPSASMALDIEIHPERGRYFVTTQDLSPGINIYVSLGITLNSKYCRRCNSSGRTICCSSRIRVPSKPLCSLSEENAYPNPMFWMCHCKH